MFKCSDQEFLPKYNIWNENFTLQNEHAVIPDDKTQHINLINHIYSSKYSASGTKKKLRSNRKFQIITIIAVNAQSHTLKRGSFHVQNIDMSYRAWQRAMLAHCAKIGCAYLLKAS